MSQTDANVSDINKYFDISYDQSLVSTRVWPFVDRKNSNISMICYLYSMAKANLEGHEDELSQKVIFISELMADDLGKVKTMTRAKAFDNLIEAVGYLMKNQNLNKYVDIDAESWSNAMTVEKILCKHSSLIYIEELKSFPWNDDIENNLYSGDAMIILSWLAKKAKTYSITAVVKICITAFISFCRGGRPTNNTLRKITELVMEELQMQIEIDQYEIHMIYEVFGHLLNEKNTRIIFDKLLGMLPDNAINTRKYLIYISTRVSLCLKTIQEALQLAPGFPWTIVESIIPGELQIAYNATVEHHNNPYIIYNETYRQRMKHYQNLAYVCKELMIKVFMKHSLLYYPGWTKTPTSKIFLDMLVCKYKYDLSYVTGPFFNLHL